MGYIYKITAPNDRVYIGQTIHTIQKRWKEHIIDANDFNKNRCKALNASIRKYGYENFNVDMLIECTNEQLNYYEIQYIQEYNSLAPNGLNLKLGGSCGKHIQQTKDKIMNTLKGCEVPHSRRLKLSYTKKQNDLPMYIIEYKEKGNIVGYRVCNHPNAGEKKFKDKSLSLEANLAKAKDHLDYLNSLETPIIPKRNILEKGISICKNGYRVRHKGKEKYFMSSSISDQEKYRNALTFLNELHSNEKGSETKRQ